MERAAFLRARKFLNYHPVAKWTALIAAVGTGVFYVLLLVVLGLFVDLAVNRGEIPPYHLLAPDDQLAFAARWKNALEHSPGGTLEETLSQHGREGEREQWQGSFDALKKHFAGPAPDDTKKPPEDKQPADEKKQPDEKAKKRAEEAAKKLAETKAAEAETKAVLALQLMLSLHELGVEDQQLERLTLLCTGIPEDGRLYEQRLEVLWRVHLNRFLEESVGADAALLYRERLAKVIQSVGTEIALTREVGDLGVLSLVVGTENRWAGMPIAWIASWNPWMWSSGNLTYLAGLLIIAVVLGLLRAVLMFVNAYMAALTTIEATTRLRRAVYHQTFRLGTLAFRSFGPSEAVSVSTRHLEVVHDGLYAWLTVVFREPVKLGLLLLFALLVNFRLALVFLLFALLVWLVGGQIAAYFRRLGRTAAQRAADQLVLMQESLVLMRLVKVYLMELFNQSRVERQLARHAAALTRRYRGEAIYRPVLVFLGLLASLILLFLVGIVVLHGEIGVTSCLVMAAALVSLYWPMVNWLEHRRLLRRSRDSAEVLFKFLDRRGDVPQVVEAEFLNPLSKQLEFDNVTINEPGTGRKLLDGVSLTIRAGQRIAFVGPDEMEKHALVYLIPRFLDPASGEIRIDGKNLRWVTLESLRAQIAIVLQHNLVFNDTVANNIGCGDPAFTLPRIIEAAKLAHAHQFIQKLPQGYETPIGEMGEPLNVGEQFRIALARAILRDPALLIVEEPLIPLDENTKALLDDTFIRVLPGRTVIFIPHRLSTIRNCDSVYLLYGGKIEAQGDHRDLLRENDLYRHLQYLEFNEFVGVVQTPAAAARVET